MHHRKTSQTSNRSSCHGVVITGNRLRHAVLNGPFLKRLKFESAHGSCKIVKTERKKKKVFGRKECKECRDVRPCCSFMTRHAVLTVKRKSVTYVLLRGRGRR